MILQVKDPNKVPHGGKFIWKCSDCEAVFFHHTVPHLFDQAKKHCEANGHSFSNAEFTKSLCANTPGDTCHEVDEGDHHNPSWYTLAVQAADAMVNWAKIGFKLSSQEVLENRQLICQSCPEWEGLTGGSYLSGRCRRCGCSGVKLALPSERCPMGKWERAT